MSETAPVSVDELALRVTQALGAYDLDVLVPLLHGRDLFLGRAAQQISNLRPIFRAAADDGINLLFPPEDFKVWLSVTLLLNADGTPARVNTRASRLTTLRGLYRTLRGLRLMQVDPLVDFVPPGHERREDALPSRAALEALLRGAKGDAALHAALLLLWQHAVPVETLLRLRWSAFDVTGRALLRGDMVSALTGEAATALERLHHRAGYDPLFPETLDAVSARRVFPYDTADALRLRVFQVTREAGVAFIPPGLIRRAALRDHAVSAAALGYRDERHFNRLVTLARQVARQAV